MVDDGLKAFRQVTANWKRNVRMVEPAAVKSGPVPLRHTLGGRRILLEDAFGEGGIPIMVGVMSRQLVGRYDGL